MTYKTQLAARTKEVKELGFRRRELRLAAGLTQREVAAQCNVTRSGVIRWEAGFPMTAIYALRLSKVLNASLEEIVGDVDDGNNAA